MRKLTHHQTTWRIARDGFPVVTWLTGCLLVFGFTLQYGITIGFYCLHGAVNRPESVCIYSIYSIYSIRIATKRHLLSSENAVYY